MTKIRLLLPCQVDKKEHKKGTEIEVEPSKADRMIAAGKAERVVERGKSMLTRSTKKGDD